MVVLDESIVASPELQQAVSRGRAARQELELVTRQLASLKNENKSLETELKGLDQESFFPSREEVFSLSQIRSHTSRLSTAAGEAAPRAGDHFRSLAKRFDEAAFARCNSEAVRDGLYELLEAIDALTVSTVVSENYAHQVGRSFNEELEKIRVGEEEAHLERMRRLAEARRRFEAKLVKQRTQLMAGLEKKKALFEECEALEAELLLHDAELTLLRHEANRLEERRRKLAAQLAVAPENR